MGVRSQDYLIRRVRELCKLPHETEWAEFKQNSSNPDDIGEYISALSNSAALAGKQHGYVLWGIEDQTHVLVGTGFAPFRAKKGSEDLTSWLARLLNPQIEFKFYELELNGARLVLLEIPRCHSSCSIQE